jgi:hypothetical protein
MDAHPSVFCYYIINTQHADVVPGVTDTLIRPTIRIALAHVALE